MGNLKCKSKSHYDSLLRDSVISIFGEGGGAMQGKQQVKSNGKCCKLTQMSKNFSLKKSGQVLPLVILTEIRFALSHTLTALN